MPSSAPSKSTAGDWQVSIHFQEPPNETAVRALVALASGADTANALAFETIAVRDWVSASLAGLAPVDAGRFVVHGGHDRARVAQQPHRDRDRGGARLRHRPPRHYARLPVGARRHRQGRPAAQHPRRRHRQRRACDRCGARCCIVRFWRATSISPPCAPPARMCGAIAPAHVTVIRAAGVARSAVRRARALRPRVRQYPARPAATTGAADPDARCAPGAGRALRPPAGARQCGLAAYRAQGFALLRRIDLDGWTTLVLRRGVAVRRQHQ